MFDVLAKYDDQTLAASKPLVTMDKVITPPLNEISSAIKPSTSTHHSSQIQISSNRKIFFHDSILASHFTYL